MFKRIAIVASFILTLSIGFIGLMTLSPSLAVGDDGILARVPKCYKDGKEVLFEKIPPRFLWNVGVGIAAAIVNPITGDPMVGVDQEHLQLFTPEFQAFVLFHECAHHELGHTNKSTLNAVTSSSVEYVENDADCWAIKKLHEHGFSDEQFEKVFDDMVDIPKLKKALGGVKPTEYAAKAYSSPEERAKHAKMCLLELKHR